MMTAAFGALRWASMRVRPLAATRSVVTRAALILAGSADPARRMASASTWAESYPRAAIASGVLP